MTREFRYPAQLPELGERWIDDAGRPTERFRAAFAALVIQADGQGGDALYDVATQVSALEQIQTLQQQLTEIGNTLGGLASRVEVMEASGSIESIADNLQFTTVTLGDLVINDESDFQATTNTVPTGRVVGSGTGLTGGGDLSSDRTLAIDSASSPTTANFNVTGQYRVGGTKVVGSRQSAITSLTDNTGVTHDDTVEDIGTITSLTDNSSGTTDAVIEFVDDTSLNNESSSINNNFAELAAAVGELQTAVQRLENNDSDISAKAEELLSAVRNHGLIAT